jgi:hypothetical protein
VKLEKNFVSHRQFGYHLTISFNFDTMTFEEYLIAKKIDGNAFQRAEALLYKNWKDEFEQINPKSFTARNLYLINPIRRKYHLKQEPVKVKEIAAASVMAINDQIANDEPGPDSFISGDSITPVAQPGIPPATPASKPARPVFKPKPKIT